MTCKREGCKNPTKGPRARFCSGACKVAHHRKEKKPVGLIDVPPDTSLPVTTSAGPRDLTRPCPPDCPNKDDGKHLHGIPEVVIGHAMSTNEVGMGKFEKPCAEGGIKHGGTGCTHGTFRNELKGDGVIRREELPTKMLVCGCMEAENGKVTRLTRDLCQVHNSKSLVVPCPDACPHKGEDHMHARVGIKIEKATLKAGMIVSAPLDRSHSPGCPCWTCKGVPSKKKPEPKKR